MTSTAGRKGKLYWSADNSDDSYHLVAGIDTVTGGPESPEITDDEFGVEYEQSITGIIGMSLTFSGGLRTGDTNGQMAMMAAQIAGTSPNGYAAFFWDGTTNGWIAPVNITKFGIDTKTRDKTNVSIEAKSTGVFTIGAISLPTA